MEILCIHFQLFGHQDWIYHKEELRDTCLVCGSFIEINLSQSVHMKLSIWPLWDGNGETKLGPKYRIQLSFLRSCFCKSGFYSLHEMSEWSGQRRWHLSAFCKHRIFILSWQSAESPKKKTFYPTQKGTTIGLISIIQCSWSALVWNPSLSARASLGFTVNVWNLALPFFFLKCQVEVDRNFCE